MVRRVKSAEIGVAGRVVVGAGADEGEDLLPIGDADRADPGLLVDDPGDRLGGGPVEPLLQDAEGLFGYLQRPPEKMVPNLSYMLR